MAQCLRGLLLAQKNPRAVKPAGSENGDIDGFKVSVF